MPGMHRMQPRAFNLYHRLFLPGMDGFARGQCDIGFRRSVSTAALPVGI
jgi:hypothetical protein